MNNVSQDSYNKYYVWFIASPAHPVPDIPKRSPISAQTIDVT